jgi:hypothetical protein
MQKQPANPPHPVVNTDSAVEINCTNPMRSGRHTSGQISVTTSSHPLPEPPLSSRSAQDLRYSGSNPMHMADAGRSMRRVVRGRASVDGAQPGAPSRSVVDRILQPRVRPALSVGSQRIGEAAGDEMVHMASPLHAAEKQAGSGTAATEALEGRSSVNAPRSARALGVVRPPANAASQNPLHHGHSSGDGNSC